MDNKDIVLQPIDDINTDIDADTGVKAPVRVSTASNVFIDPRTTKIKETVMAKVDSNEMFTAFDVTKDIRTFGLTMKHDMVKGVVHEMWDNGDMVGYNRKVVNLGRAKPFVYFPITGDASSYRG
jgi:hypothetical protein